MTSDQIKRKTQIEKLDSTIHKIQPKINSLERDKYIKAEELKILNERIKVSQQEFSNKKRRSDLLRLSRQRVSVNNKIKQLSSKVISENEEKGKFEILRSMLIQEQNLPQSSIN